MEVLDLLGKEGLVGGGGGVDQLSSAAEDKWLALLNGRTSVAGWRETQ